MDAERGRILGANPSMLSLEGAHALLNSFCSICHVKPFPVRAPRTWREEGAPRVPQSGSIKQVGI